MIIESYTFEGPSGFRKHLFNQLNDAHLYSPTGVLHRIWTRGGYRVVPRFDHIVVVSENTRPIGVGYLPMNEFFGWDDEVDDCSIRFGCVNFYVTPERRGQGIGTVIADRLIEQAQITSYVADVKAKKILINRINKGDSIDWIPK